MQEKEKRRRLCAGTLVMGNCQFPGDQPGVRYAHGNQISLLRIVSSPGGAPCDLLHGFWTKEELIGLLHPREMLGKRHNKHHLSMQSLLTIYGEQLWYNEILVDTWCLEISSFKNVVESGKRNRGRRRWKGEGEGEGCR